MLDGPSRAGGVGDERRPRERRANCPPSRLRDTDVAGMSSEARCSGQSWGHLWALLVLTALIAASCRDFNDYAPSPGAEGGADSKACDSSGGTGGSTPSVHIGGEAGTLSIQRGGAPATGAAGDEGGHAGSSPPEGRGDVGDSSSGLGGAGQGDGGANQAGSGGQAGSDGKDGGAGGDLGGDGDVIIEPFCYEPGYHPPLAGFVPPSDIALNRSIGNLLQLFATGRELNIVAATWQATPSPQSEWVWWGCFNVVPSPDRITAVTLENAYSAVFATSLDGTLWSRYAFPNWGPWQLLKAPPGSQKIVDLDAVTAIGDLNRLYAARDGHVFMRHAGQPGPYAELGTWRSVAELSIRHVAACRVGVNVDRLFVTTSDHELLSAEVNVTDGSEPTWSKASELALETIDCVRDALGKLELFATDSSHRVWRSFEPFETWQLASWSPAAVATIDVAPVPNGEPMLAALGADGIIRLWRNADEGWQVWKGTL